MSSRERIVRSPRVSQKVRMRSSTTSFCNLDRSNIPKALQTISMVDLLRRHARRSDEEHRNSKTPSKPKDTVLYFSGHRMTVSHLESDAIADVVALRAINDSRRKRPNGSFSFASGAPLVQLPILLYPSVAVKMKSWLNRARRRIVLRNQLEQSNFAGAWRKEHLQRFTLREWKAQLQTLKKFHLQKVKRAFRGWRQAVQVARKFRIDTIAILNGIVTSFKARRAFLVWRRYLLVEHAVKDGIDVETRLASVDGSNWQLQQYSHMACEAELVNRTMHYRMFNEERNQTISPYWLAWKAYTSHRKSKASQRIVLEGFQNVTARHRTCRSVLAKWRFECNAKRSVYFFAASLKRHALLRWREKYNLQVKDRQLSLKSQSYISCCSQRKVLQKWRDALTVEIKMEVLTLTRCIANRRKMLPFAFALSGNTTSYHLSKCFARWKQFTSNRLQFLLFCENEQRIFRQHILSTIFRAWKQSTRPNSKIIPKTNTTAASLQQTNNISLSVPMPNSLRLEPPWASVSTAERLFRRRQQHFRIAEALVLVPKNMQLSRRTVEFDLPPQFLLRRITQALLLCSVLTKMSFRHSYEDTDRTADEAIEQGHADYHAVIRKEVFVSSLADTPREQKLDDLVKFRLWKLKRAESEAKRIVVAQFAQKLMSYIPEHLRLAENAPLTEEFTRLLIQYIGTTMKENIKNTQSHLKYSEFLLERFNIAVMSQRLPEASHKPARPGGVPQERCSQRLARWGQSKNNPQLDLERLFLMLPKGRALESLVVSNAAPDKI